MWRESAVMSPTDLPPDMTPAQQRRALWGRNINAQLDVLGMNVKQLQRALLAEGVDVTPQAIYAWLNGDTAPRPETQVVIARILRIAHPMLFPLGAVA